MPCWCLLSSAFLFLSHAAFLRLPFYWDELGQFVPAALDIFHAGSWIPHSTVPNVHPPGVMAYLAAFWSVAGCSLPVTRLAMLGLAAVATVMAFRWQPVDLPWRAAFWQPFFSRPPAVLRAGHAGGIGYARHVFFCSRSRCFWRISSAGGLACTVLVLVKETGLLAPAVLFLAVAGAPAARIAVVSVAACPADPLARRSPSWNWPLVRQRCFHAV